MLQPRDGRTAWRWQPRLGCVHRAEMGSFSALHFGKHAVQAWSFLNNSWRSCCSSGEGDLCFSAVGMIHHYRAEDLEPALGLQRRCLFLLSDVETSKLPALGTAKLRCRCLREV